jgi:hypothetical protein
MQYLLSMHHLVYIDSIVLKTEEGEERKLDKRKKSKKSTQYISIPNYCQPLSILFVYTVLR